MDVRKNPDFITFVAAYASFVPDNYEVDRKAPHRLINLVSYSDIVNTHLDWAFQDLALNGDDMASEWLLDHRDKHLWGRAWLALPVSVRSKYKSVGG